MKKFSRFLTTIAVFVTVFAFSCITSFAQSVQWNSNWLSSVNNITSISMDTAPNWFKSYLNQSESSGVVSGRLDVHNCYNFFYEGYVTCSSESFLTPGLTYSGNYHIPFTLVDSLSRTYPSYTYETELYTYDASLILDGEEIFGELVQSGSGGDTWFNFTGVEVRSTSKRAYFRVYYRAAVWAYPTKNSDAGISIIAPVFNTILDAGYDSNSGITGESSGFNDDLSNFDHSMNVGNEKENALTDKAIGDVNSFEFKDIKDDSSILSSLTFYSSVINLAYGSLGSTVQTLFAVSFGVLIVIFILRIRRDSS